MRKPQPPILLIDADDFSIFASVASAESHVEAIDIMAGAYDLYESRGFKLGAAVGGKWEKVSLHVDPAVPPNPEFVATAVVGQLRRLASPLQ